MGAWQVGQPEVAQAVFADEERASCRAIGETNGTGGRVVYTMNSMKNLKISAAIEAKLKTKHNVTIPEIRQCFLNRTGKLLVDNRALTKTNPPTLWFLALTNKNRCLKIVYIQKGFEFHLKTAFEPNTDELAIYHRYGGA
jgi:hypothetical protein